MHRGLTAFMTAPSSRHMYSLHKAPSVDAVTLSINAQLESCGRTHIFRPRKLSLLTISLAGFYCS